MAEVPLLMGTIREVTTMAMSDNIKIFRKDAGLTQKELAKKTGLSFSMISKLESGEQTNPSLETIRRIADVLRVMPGELLNTPLSIEEQIDEYIEYKRGLNKTRPVSASTGAENEARNEDPCIDMDFRRKLYAMNEDEINQVARLIETFKRR
jgi:transcriptional regulator with XRE-family HTH domain